jgi:hypothetical protein
MIWHSQATQTFQPIRRSAAATRRWFA